MFVQTRYNYFWLLIKSCMQYLNINSNGVALWPIGLHRAGLIDPGLHVCALIQIYFENERFCVVNCFPTHMKIFWLLVIRY